MSLQATTVMMHWKQDLPLSDDSVDTVSLSQRSMLKLI